MRAADPDIFSAAPDLAWWPARIPPRMTPREPVQRHRLASERLRKSGPRPASGRSRRNASINISKFGRAESALKRVGVVKGALQAGEGLLHPKVLQQLRARGCSPGLRASGRTGLLRRRRAGRCTRRRRLARSRPSRPSARPCAPMKSDRSVRGSRSPSWRPPRRSRRSSSRDRLLDRLARQPRGQRAAMLVFDDLGRQRGRLGLARRLRFSARWAALGATRARVRCRGARPLRGRQRRRRGRGPRRRSPRACGRARRSRCRCRRACSGNLDPLPGAPLRLARTDQGPRKVSEARTAAPAPPAMSAGGRARRSAIERVGSSAAGSARATPYPAHGPTPGHLGPSDEPDRPARSFCQRRSTSPERSKADLAGQALFSDPKRRPSSACT